MPLIKQLKSTIGRYALLRRSDRIIVAVSGGPDSMALLYALNELKDEFGIKLCVAHLDHMLRAGSGKDAKFVAGEAQKLGLEAIVARINVRKLSRKGSVEEIARNARHYFLFQAADKFRTKKIALAHTLDDQAETVLMRIIRGSGLYGLTGIAPLRKIGRHKMIRPLLETSRQAVVAFLKKRRIRYLTDPSNSDEIFLRNKIRHKLLPYLEKNFAPNIKVLLARLAETCACDYDRLFNESEKAMLWFRQGINLKKFAKLHPSLQRMVLRSSIQRVKGNLRRIDLQHLREIEDMLLNRPAGSVVDLPQGVSALKKPKSLIFYQRKNQ